MSEAIPMTNTTRAPIVVRSSAILTSTFVSGNILNVDGYRTVRLWFSVTCASAANEPKVLVLLSPGVFGKAAHGTAPLAGDDAWFAPGEFDGTYTDEDIESGATLATGSDFTKAPGWRDALVRPLKIGFDPADNATDKIRLCIKVDVTGARWMQVQACDVDAAGTLATMAISATLSA